ncbi:MAG: Holliday junction resolvase RuvX [bacterium]|nr:Holliday junction resolvase RuvX [bacterium]
MQILCLDVGDSRIGVAFADRQTRIAHPLETVERERNCYNILISLIKSRSISSIVIGLPLEKDGSEGLQAKKTRRFAEKLTGAIASSEIAIKPIGIHFWDERFSTAQSERTLIGSKLKNKERSQALDRISASLILQSYLDSGKEITA